ncbi:unnamed protein product [Notodromas monacha]|uniref:Angiotensin-converting enzyme n=1 Tax=Notodromas monacha TaxID=399045 RepID=A0A7R9BMA5_9CRUS|nr:unnamed protein product [Notodromas monacha]CAG0918117.1 unnamed protein product [Notodromas monacha]
MLGGQIPHQKEISQRCSSISLPKSMGPKFATVIVLAIIAVTATSASVLASKNQQPSEEEQALTWLSSLDEEYSLQCNAQMVARWDYIVNVTDETAAISTQANEVYATFKKDAWERVTAAFDANGQFPNWESYSDSVLVRKIRKLKDSAKDSILTGTDLTNYLTLQAEMETIYAAATICNLDGTECGLALEPRYPSGDAMWVSPYDEPYFQQQIAAVWEEMKPWYKKLHAYVRRRLVEHYGSDKVDPTGPIPAQLLGNPWAQQWGNIADLTIPYPDASSVDVTAALNEQGYTVEQIFRTSEEFFTSLGLEPMTDTFWEKSMLEKPEGREVVCHASAEDFCLGPGSEDFRQDQDVYCLVGSAKVVPSGALPCVSHKGNPWAQQWGNIADLTIPYPDASSVDVTAALNEQGYTVEQIFRTSEEFFTSLGLEPMTDTFWEKSMLEKPEGREVVCHASAEDFCLGPGSEDFRIKMCTAINQDDFITVHHEMGHIQYFQQYRNQPFIFRDGANPGFHEAIGDTLALSVATPKHLQTIGLLTNYQESLEADINYLLAMALDKIAFLPFAYVMDSWRWDLFGNATQAEVMNGHWWNLRETIQGVSPPVERTENDFDPGAKYHIPANVPYVRYFVSFIIQFQFYESLCLAAGEYDPNDPAKPLYKCDFYQNAEAGQLMENALKLGYSLPWTETMEAITGQREMSAASLQAYFKPLEEFMDNYLAETGDCIGWGDECLKTKN